MTSSVINPNKLWKITDSPDEGGATTAGGVQMAIITGSFDTPHDFCKGRAAAKDELEKIAEDSDDEEGDGISADQEDNVFIAAGKALRFSNQWRQPGLTVPEEIADYNENNQTPYEYVQDGLSNLSRTAISNMSSYERKVETWLLKQDPIADNFGNTTTVYLQDIIKSWETWKKSPSNDMKPERPQLWCDICGKSTDSVSKAVTIKAIDIKWNPNDNDIDPKEIYKKPKNKKNPQYTPYIRVLGNFLMTFLHPEDNPGNLKATMVFDMNSAGLKHTLSVLPQITNTICPQVVSDSAPTSMEQMGPNRNILHFPVTGDNLYEYQSNLYTWPLGIRFTVTVADNTIGYNNQPVDVMNNFKLTLSFSPAQEPSAGTLSALVRDSAFTERGGEQGEWTYEMNFDRMQATVGPAVNYLASLINGILANATKEVDMRKIPEVIEKIEPGQSNMVDLSKMFAKLAENINSNFTNVANAKKVYEVLTFLLFDIKRCGDWEQARSVFYFDEATTGKPIFATGDILCGVFARLLGANCIWRSMDGSNPKKWVFRVHRKVNKQLDPSVQAAIANVQACSSIVKVLEAMQGIGELERQVRALTANAQIAYQRGIFPVKELPSNLRENIELILTYVARMRAYDTWVQCENILKAINAVKEVYEQAFAEVCRTTDAAGKNVALQGAELDSCIFDNYIMPLKTLINLFYATGNPQPQNAASYRKNIAVNTFSKLFIPSNQNAAVQDFNGRDNRVSMEIEDPYLTMIPVPQGGETVNVPQITPINTVECMTRLQRLIVVEEAAKIRLKEMGAALIQEGVTADAEAENYGSLQAAVERIKKSISSVGPDVQNIAENLANYRVDFALVPKEQDLPDGDGALVTKYFFKAQFDIGLNLKKASDLDNALLVKKRGGEDGYWDFNRGFNSPTFDFNMSSIQQMGSSLASHLSALIGENGIRFKTGPNKYIGAPMSDMRAFLGLMDQSIIKGRTGDGVQIVTPDENIANIARAFTRSNEPGTWGDFSSSTKGTKKNPNYLAAVDDVFSFCNEVTMVMLTTSMGVLSNFRIATWETQINANVDSFKDAGKGDGWNSARAVLAEGETSLYNQLDESNKLSFPGFELKGMSNPEWNQLPGRFSPTTVKLALASKTVMVDWFHQLLGGLTPMRKNSSAVWQYTVPPLDERAGNALTRLSSYKLSSDELLPEWAQAERTYLVDTPIGIQGAEQYSNFQNGDGGQEGYKKLIQDVLTILQFAPRCLPLIHTTMTFYARAINLMFSEAADDGETLRNILTMDKRFSIGFNISDAVNDEKHYSGKILENPTIDDTIKAALLCLSSSIAVRYPSPIDFNKVAAGGSNQSGGDGKANVELQDELLKDLFLDITGIASNAMYTILSKNVIINAGAAGIDPGAAGIDPGANVEMPIFDTGTKERVASVSVIKTIQGFYEEWMTEGVGASAQALETFLIILTIVRKGIHLSKIVALANNKDPPLQTAARELNVMPEEEREEAMQAYRPYERKEIESLLDPESPKNLAYRFVHKMSGAERAEILSSLTDHNPQLREEISPFLTLELEIRDLLKSFQDGDDDEEDEEEDVDGKYKVDDEDPMYKSIELLSRIPIINEIAESLYAYSNDIRGTWGAGMLQIQSLEMEHVRKDGVKIVFEYTPTLSDLVLSTALSLSGDISGEVDIDSQFLQGIYYTGPLNKYVDSGYFQEKSNVFNPPSYVMSGLPCFYSLFVYLKAKRENKTAEQLFGVENLSELGDTARLPHDLEYDSFLRGYPMLRLLAQAEEDIYKPSILLYQFLKVMEGREKDWEREAKMIIDTSSGYPSIIQQLRVWDASKRSVYFMSPAYKNIQTLCMISGLINNSVKEQKAAVTNNIEILLNPEENPFATYNSARFHKAILDLNRRILAGEKIENLQSVINNLIDMINSSNGYDISTYDAEAKKYKIPQEPGMVDETYLAQQMDNRNLVAFVPYLSSPMTPELLQEYFGDEEGEGGLLNDAINRNKRYSRFKNTAEKLVLDTQFKCPDGGAEDGEVPSMVPSKVDADDESDEEEDESDEEDEEGVDPVAEGVDPVAEEGVDPGAEEEGVDPGAETCKRLPVGFVNNPVIHLLWHDFGNTLKNGRKYQLLKKRATSNYFDSYSWVNQAEEAKQDPILKLYNLLLLYTLNGQIEGRYTNYLAKGEIKQIFSLAGGAHDKSEKKPRKKRKTRRKRVKNKRNTRKNQN